MRDANELITGHRHAISVATHQLQFGVPVKNTALFLILRRMRAPILALIFFMGVYPKPFLSRMKASVELVIQRVESKQEALPLVLEGRNNGVTRADGSTNSPYFEATMSLSNGN